MKRSKQLNGTVMALCALLLFSGCASISVNFDYDTAADFSQYKSYTWKNMDGNGSSTGSDVPNNGLFSSRVQRSVDSQMAARGIQKSDKGSDLLVVHHFGAKDKIQVTDWGYSYSPYYRHGGYGYGGRQIDVYQYTEGTLVIDLVDAKTNSLVWRGTGTGVIDSEQKTPEEVQVKIDHAVAEIMASFPPEN